MTSWYTFLVALAVGITLGALIGGFHGVIIAYIGVPSFIVTLGGLLVWRGLVFQIQQGQTISPMDGTFAIIGGGLPRGAMGELSWIVALAGCVGIAVAMWSGRRRSRAYGFPVRPLWAAVGICVAGIAGIVATVWVLTEGYTWPPLLAKKYALDHGITEPAGGLQIPVGIAAPVLIMLVVTLVMTMIATRRRFGRYVFAIGGNPEAADLAGINTKRTILGTYVIMGILCAISGAIQTSRLGSGVTSLGTDDELSVIAAAVIGGTSFTGGIGTIPGAVLGAVVMQTLRSGMLTLKVDSPIQDIVVGSVLVAAVAAQHDPQPARQVAQEQSDDSRDYQQPPLVLMRDMRVSFGGVHAVNSVTVDLRPGEVVGLVGGNGAGKSTLMRALSGAHPADGGDIFINGRPCVIPNPRAAKDLGIETIYQTLALADNVDAAANMFLGRELTTRIGSLDDAAMESATRKVIGRLNPNFKNFKTPVRLPVGRPAAVRRNRACGPFQRQDPDHGRAHRGARPGRDGSGSRSDQAAEVRGNRHLPDQPRHPRRVRSGGPHQRHAPRQAGRYGQQGRRHDGRSPGHDHHGQDARRGHPARSGEPPRLTQP